MLWMACALTDSRWYAASVVVTRQQGLCIPLPNGSVVGIHYPVIPMQILPGREVLSSRLEQSHSIALLCQYCRSSNGHIIYYGV